MTEKQIEDIKMLATRHQMQNCEQISEENGAFGACIHAFYEWECCKADNRKLRAALRKIATPALGEKHQQSLAREALGNE